MGGAGGAGGKPAFCKTTKCPSATPICDNDAGACRGCNETSIQNACGDLDAGTAFCALDAGLITGRCVGCRSNSDCSDATPICDTKTLTCTGCNNEGSDACKVLNSATPACVTSAGTSTSPKVGTCVGCLSNANCVGKTPICNLSTNVCMACTADTDCAAVSPGICMTDGHCATDAETIYVKNDSMTTCNDNPSVSDGGANAGTKAQPFCSMPPLSFVSANRDLVLIDGTGLTVTGGNWTYADQAKPQLSIVGQQGATIGSVSTPAFSMQSGSVYIRGVTFSRSGSSGIKATGGNLTLNGVKVDNCGGGGLVLSGATFDIEDTTVTNNGPGPSGTSGGINISTAGSGSKLNLVTVTGNTPIGVACDAPIPATGVYVMSNIGSQIAGNCNFTSCTQTAAGCGAQ